MGTSCFLLTKDDEFVDRGAPGVFLSLPSFVAPPRLFNFRQVERTRSLEGEECNASANEKPQRGTRFKMVHITEIRVPLPMTVEEFRRGQRYANWKTNEANTSEGQGGQLVSSAPYVDEIWGEGSFTHSLYRLGDRLPDWVTKLVPANALVIDEKTWMAYPYVRSVLTVPFFHKLKIEMVSLHENDAGTAENILGLSEAELAIRKIDVVDIAMDKVQKRDYQAKLDPQLVDSKKTGRGPLKSGWQNSTTPMMCAYKLVNVEANYWGVQNRVEKLMLNGVRQIVLLTHRNAFGYIDEWYDLTFEEISGRETEERKRLQNIVKHPPIIDPTTGLEFVVEEGDDDKSGTNKGNESSVNSGDDDDVDMEEFFEATMEWTTQEAEEFGESLISGVSITSFNWKVAGEAEKCAVCEARKQTSTKAQVACETCKEFFCQKCFSEFHITARLRDHSRQYITTGQSSTSLKEDSGEGSRKIAVDRRADQSREDVSGLGRTLSSPPVVQGNATSKSTDGAPQRVKTMKSIDSIEKEEKAAHQRDPSWLEEFNGSPDVPPGCPAPPLSKMRSSNYRVLNSQADSSLDQSQELAPSMSGKVAALPIPKKPRVRPNELSEEMVRSISSLYQPQLEKKTVGETVLDPYGVQDSLDIGVYAKCSAITVTPELENNKDSDIYKHIRALVELLQGVDPRDMTHEQRLAFWINLYNSLMMQAYIVSGVPRSHYKRIAFMHKSAYIVGGHLFSALAIEHAILRACSYRPALASLLPVHKYKKHDPRQVYALDRPEPLVSFALCCGSHSSPMVRVYTAAGVQTELQEACRDFLTASVGVTKHYRLIIPKIMHWYARDFSNDAKSLIKWIAQQVPQDKRVIVEECLQRKKGGKSSQLLSIVSYDWNFRYLFKKVPDP